MHNYGAGSSQGVAYQGYPYTNPVVIDIPSISAKDAARWNQLPKRTAPGIPVRSGGDPGGSGSGGQTSTNFNSRIPAEVQNTQALSSPGSDDGLTPKLDPDENPVVYIDFPESSGSDVADRRQVEDDQTYVQDTIFYDPFKDRRIDSPPSSSSGSVRSLDPPGSGADRPRVYIRPMPPNTLNFGPSDRVHPGGSSSSNIPAIMSKETDVYSQFGVSNNGFEMTSRDFPEPPPAYSEFDATSPTPQMAPPAPSETSSPVTPDVTSQGVTPDSQPRTQVIVPQGNSGNSAYIFCYNCGYECHCLIIRQVGFATHLIACCFLLFGMIPFVFLVYCTNYFKYKHYYCRLCNKLVAYKVPLPYQDLTYVK